MVRVPPAQLERVDAWAAEQPDEPGRPEAIRRLVDKGLGRPAGDTTDPDMGGQQG